MKWMKQLALCLIMVLAVVSCKENQAVNITDLPPTAAQYVVDNFGADAVAQVMTDREGLTKNFKVFLKEGVQLEFDSDGKITGIDGQKALPTSVIPEAITTYVTEKFPNNKVTDWELDDRKQQKVKLDNGFELVFDQQGKFVRMDD